MFYAMLVSMMCSGFQCELSVESQWQANDFQQVKQQCEAKRETLDGSQCLFYFEQDI